MSKFRYSLNAGTSWTVIDAALPYNIPSATADTVLVEPIGATVSISGTAVLWTPANDTTLVQYWDARDLADGAVAFWQARGPRAGKSIQTTGSAQPVKASGLVAFDGINDRLIQTRYPMRTSEVALLSASNLPDASGNNGAGSGFTITGLSKAADGTWWATNYGLGVPSDTVWAPSLVHLSADFSTKIEEILLVPLFAGIQSVQGLFIHPSGDLFFTDIVAKKIRRITTSGAIVSEWTCPGASTPNGLAYNPTNLSFFVNTQDNNNIYEVRISDGATLRTYSYSEEGGSDHLWYDDTSKLLWISYGPNQVPGYLSCLNLRTNSLVGSYEMPGADSIEGIVLDPTNNKIFIANDARFHSGTPNTNRILTYSLPYPAAGAGLLPVVDLWALCKFVTISTATKAILILGQPTVGTPVEQCNGVGIYATSATGVRAIALTNDGAAFHTVTGNGTVPDLTAGEHLIYARVDTAADLISLWCDGVSIGTTAAGALDDNRLTIGSVINLGGATSFFGNVAIRTAGFHDGPGDRVRVEGSVLWAAGLQVNLPAGHAYKTAAPLAA